MGLSLAAKKKKSSGSGQTFAGPVSEKPDEQLYFIEKDAGTKREGKLKTKKLRCFQNIGSYSKVPPPIKPSGVPYSKKIKIYSTKVEERENKNIYLALQKPKKVSTKLVQKGDRYCAEIKDLWAEEEPVDPEVEDLINFRDVYTCKKTPKVPCHRYQKPSLLPSVEVPHSGASYNPDYFDHQELLSQAVKIEEAKQKEELHLKRVLTDMFPTREEAPTEESILQEMSQGLFEEDEEEENETGSTLISNNPPVRVKNRITRARKRRREELQEKERLKKQEKLQKVRMNQFYRLRSIKKEIKEKDALTQKKIERNIQRKADKMYKPKVLSRYKYEAPVLEVKLTGELCGSMRTLEPEGSLLEDRYKSLQRRNLLETRIKQKMKRKYKRKIQVKRSHRNFE
ncbi:ribosome biogenesis protein NOP53 [Trichonephila inaurata madagascariensis]|uniref:Ribosome biogenesis protein NOP53 n=1 Tax=Trichonephila inaurata madagascariensis TaxID=2747483 RepID=A0A8X7BT84_9ARAC|nr:ribosome biogenesis protein NOP53 [Trichonephila inaurata madagascariensis]